jgi:pyruvate dehydrogenase E2 component (dihydrolipoamide acetyltransferase)
VEEIFVPASGMAMEEALLAEWLKQPGDRVDAGEAVAVVETDKASVELSADAPGVLGRHLYAAGATVKPGATIAHVLADGESEPSPAAAAAGSGAAPASGGSGQVNVEAGVAAPGSARPRQQLSPRQRRVAALAASAKAPPVFSRPSSDGAPGPVAAPVSAPPAPVSPAPTPVSPVEVPAVPVGAPAIPADDGFRRAIAAQVAESWRTIPHFAVGRDVNARGLTETLAVARRYNRSMTITDFLLSGLGQALVRFGKSSDIGLAVATEWGVLIPIVRDAGGVPMDELARRRKDAVDRARSRRLSSDDAIKPYATLSNLGALGVDWFTGVVPVGQKVLLTVGRVADRPVVEGRGIAVRPQFSATLTADHRELDGAESARLLGYFVDAVETVGKEMGG